MGHFIIGTKHDKGDVTVIMTEMDDDGKPTGKVVEERGVEVSGFLGIDKHNQLVLAKTSEELPKVDRDEQPRTSKKK